MQGKGAEKRHSGHLAGGITLAPHAFAGAAIRGATTREAKGP